MAGSALHVLYSPSRTKAHSWNQCPSQGMYFSWWWQKYKRANPTVQAHFKSLCHTCEHLVGQSKSHEPKAKVQGNTLNLLWEKLQFHCKGHEHREGLRIETKNSITKKKKKISHGPFSTSCRNNPAFLALNVGMWGSNYSQFGSLSPNQDTQESTGSNI